MKANVLLSLLVLLTPLAAQDKPAPVEIKPAADKAELLPNQKAFLNLPEESRAAFAKHLGEANRVFQQKRIFETLDEVDKASAIFKDSPELYSLRGNCYVEMRAFDKALAEFNKAAALSKDNPTIEFNLAEVYFCTKKWQQSLEMLEKVLKKIPTENINFSRLVEFKILLCKKKLGLKDEVIALGEKYDYLDDSPYYYYAKAIFAYDAKNISKAEDWLAIASRVFQDPNIIAPWQDTLIEFGYIKSYYGSDEPVSE